jgi:hypothetical protein
LTALEGEGIIAIDKKKGGERKRVGGHSLCPSSDLNWAAYSLINARLMRR